MLYKFSYVCTICIDKKMTSRSAWQISQKWLVKKSLQESNYLPYHTTEKQYARPIIFERRPKILQSSTAFQSFGSKSHDICKFLGNRRNFSSDVRNTSGDRVTFGNRWGSSKINFRAALVSFRRSSIIFKQSLPEIYLPVHNLMRMR